MKKFKILPYIILSFLVCFFTTYSSVIYKDISSVSIKLNFVEEYDDIVENGMPDISYGEDSSYNVYTINTRYYIESADWYDSNTEKDFVIGGTPKIVLFLSTKDYPYDSSSNEYYYRFVSGYSQSTCSISGGEFVSAQRLGISSLKVICKIKGIKGTYKEPQNVTWVDEKGYATWEGVNNSDSGYYDIALYRDDTKITTITKHRGNSYNFYNYMTREGSYTISVRTVPGTDMQLTYGKKSELAYSGSLYISAEDVYDGTQINNAGSDYGWIQTSGGWSFRNPNGDYVKSQWLQWNNKWYYLDQDGMMHTGWLTSKFNKTYYFNTSGIMVTGWMQDGDNYHFFNTSSGGSEGSMIKSRWVSYENRWYYFDENGNMVTGWKKITNSLGASNYYYFYPKDSVQGLYGYLATNTTINGFKVDANGVWYQ
ncbi:MAG: N-acetylmuramoyl-L-alanine amidase family protein [Eubacteriales bacterium]|nr:N-acetylmuramoyl-L-alanine amidase family protein [Eubacteriales bacterium]